MLHCDGPFKLTTKDSLTKIERDGSLIGTVNQGRFRLLEAECQARQIATEYLCDSIPEWIAYVEKHEVKRGFGSHQFWNGIRVALESDGIIGCYPLVAPSSFMFSSWDGVSADWGYQLHPRRPKFKIHWDPENRLGSGFHDRRSGPACKSPLILWHPQEAHQTS